MGLRSVPVRIFAEQGQLQFARHGEADDRALTGPGRYNRALISLKSAPGGATAMSEVANEASRRRTFAIISHPDAGKTTLTESCCCSEARSRWPVR